MLGGPKSFSKSFGTKLGTAAALGALLLLPGCSDPNTAQYGSVARSASSASPAAPAPAQPTALESQLKRQNALLLAEVQALRKQVQDLSQTSQVLFEAVQAAVNTENLAQAQASADKLEQRYGPSAQSKSARADIARLQAKLKAKEEQAQRLDAMGFYALKPTSAAKTGEFIIKVDSLSMGTRWSFDSRDDGNHYRDVRRGEKYVLLKTTLQNTNKSHDPYLPDIAVYRIEGKNMNRIAPFTYEFRRWQSYGSFIGLYHDFKNDFAHSSSVSFNAAASIDQEIAKTPFAVVVTEGLCHERKEKIGQPEIEYQYRSQCGAKETLSVDDFKSGGNQVLGFFNKPRGL